MRWLMSKPPGDKIVLTGEMMRSRSSLRPTTTHFSGKARKARDYGIPVTAEYQMA